MADPEWIGDKIAAAKFAEPEAIRAALLPEQVADFDAAYSGALAEAGRTLRLDVLRKVLLMWRRMAFMTELDPEAHRGMPAAVEEIQRTGRPRAGSVSWDELRVELGL